MRKVTSRVTLFAGFIFMCAIIMQADGQLEKKCSSVHVRNNVSAFDKLKGCTVVEGFVQIALLDKTSEKDFTNITFPELREITQYLLVFRVKGLKSLGALFPNLALIRGTSLFANTALAIYENPKLQEIGLKSLMYIMEGSVIINKNFNLCFATSIDWGAMMKSNISQSYYEVIVTQNKEEKECSSQDACKLRGCERNLCWNKDYCQQLRLEHCHPLCAGGCYENDSASACYACKGLLSDGKCVSSCPANTYEFLKRTCVSEEQCRSTPVKARDKLNNYYYIPFNGSCVSECPSKYRKNPTNTSCIPCSENKCYKECVADSSFRITTVSESKHLQSCTHIRGSLLIVGIAGSLNSGIESALEENLGMIEEITGQLQIIHSHA